MHLAARCQRYWSDNSTSATISFHPDEAKEIPAMLRAFDGALKSVSFLPLSDLGVFPQSPYQKVRREEWEAMRKNLRPVNWDLLYDNPDGLEAEGELYCESDGCFVKESQ